MKTLVIPDIHQDLTGLNKIFKLENLDSFDEIIFLGDWFDSFYEPPKVASFKDTCLFLRDLICNNKQGKMIFLVGNHDLAYIYNNKKSGYSNVIKSNTYWCSGVTKSKISTFRQVFYDKSLRDDWFFCNFKIAHRSQGWIFSHAGVINRQIPYNMTVNQVIDNVLPDVWLNFRNVTYRQNALISAVGVARGGQDNVGGLLWLDYHNEFEASSDIGKQLILDDTEFEKWMIDHITLYNYMVVKKCEKEYDVDKVIGKYIISHLQHFFSNSLKNKTVSNRNNKKNRTVKNRKV